MDPLLIPLALIPAAQAVIVVAMLVMHRAALRDWRDERAELMRERGDLLQRIQAPQAAVIEHQLRQPMPPIEQPIPMDDDETFQQSKEELADRLMTEELGGPR